MLTIGTLGVGKSTMLNKLLGIEVFETSDKVTGCTYDFNRMDHPRGDYIVLDTPGLHD